jgi:hypothetical protein
LKNECERPHCVSGELGALRLSCVQKRKAAIVTPGPSGKPTVPVDILSNRYLKDILRIDYEKCLTSFCGHYGFNLQFSSALS